MTAGGLKKKFSPNSVIESGMLGQDLTRAVSWEKRGKGNVYLVGGMRKGFEGTSSSGEGNLLPAYQVRDIQPRSGLLGEKNGVSNPRHWERSAEGRR